MYKTKVVSCPGKGDKANDLSLVPSTPCSQVRMSQVRMSQVRMSQDIITTHYYMQVRMSAHRG